MITAHQISKRFGHHEVLQGVSMKVEPGEVHAIIGPSGAGKSIFLRCINGLESFHSGSIQVGDLQLTPQTDARGDAALLQSIRKRVGMVFQQFNLFPHLNVLQNLCESPVHVLGKDRGESETLAMQLLDRVGLAAKKDSYPRHLSGGQMQRVAIARVLMMKPSAILFDEPTSALDPVMASEVLAIMSQLARDGLTMIVVTHSMNFVRGVANKVHVFENGRNVESGPAQRVLQSPEHPVTRAFLELTS